MGSGAGARGGAGSPTTAPHRLAAIRLTALLPEHTESVVLRLAREPRRGEHTVVPRAVVSVAWRRGVPGRASQPAAPPRVAAGGRQLRGRTCGS